jgi:probable phosphomutase (TIGR03848 family)
MATVVLVRHGRSTANTAGVLAGRQPGVQLDGAGRDQVTRLGERLSVVPLVSALSSPLDRCLDTARGVLALQKEAPELQVEPGLDECDYGQWQGRALKELVTEPLWRTVQRQPSAAVFPGGESLREMQDRAVRVVRAHDRAVEAEHGPGAVWLAVSHGDVLKAVLADALGVHLDQFQRLHLDPASVSVVRWTDERPYVLGTNTHGGDLAWLATPPPAADAGAAVGGGAGPEGTAEEALG